MEYKLLALILGIIMICGCVKEPTEHYIIVQHEASFSSGHTSFEDISVELNEGKIVNGNYSLTFRGAVGNSEDCKGFYLPEKADEGKCWNVTCNITWIERICNRGIRECQEFYSNVTEYIEPCNTSEIRPHGEKLIVLTEENISREIEEINISLNPHLRERYEINKGKEGCGKEICYENGILIRYTPGSRLNWERRDIT